MLWAILLKRIIQAALAIFIISLSRFSIQDTLGDPTRELAAQSISVEERANLRESLGLNGPLPVQFGNFIKRARCARRCWPKRKKSMSMPRT